MKTRTSQLSRVIEILNDSQLKNPDQVIVDKSFCADDWYLLKITHEVKVTQFEVMMDEENEDLAEVHVMYYQNPGKRGFTVEVNRTEYLQFKNEMIAWYRANAK